MDLTPGDIERFVGEVWESMACPRCGHEDWGIGSERDFKGMLPIGDDAEASFHHVSSFLPMIWLVCQTCGHVEFIAAKAVRQWKASRDVG